MRSKCSLNWCLGICWWRGILGSSQARGCFILPHFKILSTQRLCKILGTPVVNTTASKEKWKEAREGGLSVVVQYHALHHGIRLSAPGQPLSLPIHAENVLQEYITPPHPPRKLVLLKATSRTTTTFPGGEPPCVPALVGWWRWAVDNWLKSGIWASGDGCLVLSVCYWQMASLKDWQSTQPDQKSGSPGQETKIASLSHWNCLSCDKLRWESGEVYVVMARGAFQSQAWGLGRTSRKPPRKWVSVCHPAEDQD